MTQHNRFDAVTGLIFYSGDPDRLAAFYRGLGVPLGAADHGGVGAHQEGLLSGVHVAIWSQEKGHGAAGLVPVFRAQDLEAAARAAEDLGGQRLHKPIDLGEGKRVVTLRDPDGRPFRILELM